MQMANEKYIRLAKNFTDRGILITPDKIKDHVKNPEIPHYISPYYYNQEHFNKFKETGSVAGFENLFTDKIWWDFDSKEKLTFAKNDTLTLIERLSKHVDQNKIEIFFSGSKGFHVVLNLNRELNQKQVKKVAMDFAKDLKTFDTVVYNENRYLRLVGTKHQETDFYKIPLTFDELKNLKKPSDLYEKAKSPAKDYKSLEKVEMDDSWFEIKEVEAEIKSQSLSMDFDLSTKPRNWKASKWALMQGFFKGGERDNSMMVLSATLKAMGYDETQTYSLCKDALKKSWKRYGEGEFSKEDLWNIIERTFSKKDLGQYSEKTDMFLQKKAEELGIKELTTSEIVDIKGALRIYKDYAKNISKLTLRTGIKELDEKQRITVGMAFGIVAAPGSGKTTLALTMLHSMSKEGELCIFFSYDMYAPLIVQKIIQKHWKGKENINEVFKKYEANDQEFVDKVEALITSEYPNVKFCFETGQSIEDIYIAIRNAEQTYGKKCKFVVIDYNELVISDVADPTQGSNKTAQQVRAMAQKEQLCVLSLFQPSKVTGDPSSEIMSYRAAKGGSGIEQSLRLMLGVSRPGYDPNDPDNDKFLNLKVLKNNMGQIFAVDLHWDGYKGEIRSLTPSEKVELGTLRQAKKDEKAGNDEPW